MIPFISSEDFPALGEDSGRVNPGVSTVNGKELGASSENPKIGRWRKLFGEERNIESYSSCKLPYLKPQCIDGKLISVISPEDLVDELKVCDKFLVGYFVGRKLPFHIVKEAMEKAWNLKDDFRLTLHEESMYIFEFDRDEDRIAAMELGSVTIASTLFLIRPWKLFIEQDILEMKSVPVWMNLRNVPTHLWNAKGLGMIASVVGIPLFSDLHTLNRTRMRYARVCVEMEANSEFPDFIPVVYDGKEFKVSVEYAWKPPRCLSCVTFGHSNFKCPKVGKKVWIPKMNKTITRGKGLGEGAQGIIKEAAIVDGTVAPNGNNEVGMATDFVEENLASHLQRNEVIEVTITNSANGAQLQLPEKMVDSSSQTTEIPVQSELVPRVEITVVPTLEIAVNKPTDGEWTVYSSRKNKKKQNKVSDVPTSHSISEVANLHGLHGISEVNPRDNLEGQDTQEIGVSSIIDAGRVGGPGSDNLGLRIEEIEESCNGKQGVHINSLPVIIGKPIKENATEGTFDDCDEEDSNEESEYETDMDEMTPSKLKNLQDIRRRPLSDGQKVEKLVNANTRLGVLTEGKNDAMGNIFNSIVVRSKTNPEKELGTLFWPGVSDNKNLGRGQRKSARKIRE